MSTKLINIIKGIVFIAIALFLAFTFNTSLTNFVSKVPFIGWVTGSILLRAVVSLAFARGVQLIYKAVTENKKSVLVFSIATLVGFTIAFIAQPIYNIDYGNLGDTTLTVDIEKLKEETNGEFELNSKHAVVIYFSTNCGSCKEMSKQIGELQKTNNLPQVIALFPGSIENAVEFLNENNGERFTYYMIDNDHYFQEAADYSFPSIFLVDKEGVTIQHWEGSLMNYSAFDLINEYK